MHSPDGSPAPAAGPPFAQSPPPHRSVPAPAAHPRCPPFYSSLCLSGALLTYVHAHVVCSRGARLAQVPATVPIALDIFEAHGYSQKQVAGASAAMFSIVICSGNAMGPPLGGILIQALDGLPSTATAYLWHFSGIFGYLHCSSALR